MQIKLPKKSSSEKKISQNGQDDLYQRLREQYVAFRSKLKEIDHAQQDAFDRMYEFGQMLITNKDQILDDYGTWGNFADKNGINSSFVSRCKKSVEDFMLHGADDLEKARDLLKKRQMQPTAKLMERNINRMLTDGDNAGKKKTPRQKSMKHEKHTNELKNMAQRAEEIISEHEPDDELYEEAVHIKEFLGDTVFHLESLDISQKEWNSQAYLDFCRKISFDVILGEPVDKSEPMHLSPDGTSGSMGGKVADFFAIPGCRDTHNKLDNDKLEVTKDEIAHWHRWTMAMFIYHTIAPDN